MRYTKYVFKNISAFIKNYTGIFMLIVVCQIVCILLTFFSFGVYQNFRNESRIEQQGTSEETNSETRIQISPLTPLPEQYQIAPVNFDGLYKEFGEILKDKIEEISFHAITPNTPKTEFVFFLTYESGNIIFDEQVKKNMDMISESYGGTMGWTTGRMFTRSEFINGDRVCVAPTQCCDELYESIGENIENMPEEFRYEYKTYKKGDKWYVNIEGEEYECIGFCNWAGFFIPYKNLPESIVLTDFPHIDLTAPLTPDEFADVIAAYKKYFPDADIEFDEIELVDTEQIYYYNTNMWLSVLIATISAVNLALIMNYILTKRRRTLAIFRITGCSSNNARRIYTLEIMLILNVLFVLCLTAWITLLLPALGNIFPYMQGAFSAKIYVYTYLLYMAISYVIMTIMIARYIRRQPVDLLKVR